MDKEFQGETLAISGGTRGIGKAIVYEFAKVGVDIAFICNPNVQIAKDMVEDLEQNYKIKVRAYRFNVLESETYKELSEKIDADFERVDFSISNAIISGRAVVGGYTKFMKLEPRGINNIFTAMVNAFVVGSQEAAKGTEKAGGGGIVSILSVGNLMYIENYAGHGTAKAAVEAMTRYAATEPGGKNIHVNVVSGGPIETDTLRAFTNCEEIKQTTINLSPLNRMEQPEDLAGAYLFLCSSKASWVTGYTFIVGGGTTSK